jgi:NAD(P)-dependent dehydrogenase (short-subunit alcohol dehydrogenase family)
VQRRKKKPDGRILVIGEVADVASATIAALTVEGWQVRQIVAGPTARRITGERYEADLSSPESVKHLRQLVKGSEERPIRGVINFLGLEPAARSAGLEDTETPMILAAQTFHVVKEFAEELQAGDGWFVNVTALDGHFGLGPSPPTPLPGGERGRGEGAAAAGTLGIAKTLAREYPGLRVKNVDVEPDLPTDVMAARLIGELMTPDDLVEVGWTRQGRWRVLVQDEPLPRQLPPLDINRDSVVLMTGGACGITAAIARRLAVEAKSRLILVGRSPLPGPESPRTSGRGRTALRQLFLDEARSEGGAVVPAEIERRIARVMKDREIRGTLADCAAAGAAVEYHALDVRDSLRLAAFLDEIYDRFGRLDGVIHGAGILSDRRIRDKTVDSFAAVFRTKVDSALTLARKLRPETLKFLVFFGSVSGRFGNAGQVDYSAANEVLNKLADQLHRCWPGRAVCLNWGPWQGGMVSEELRRLYQAEGVELISVEQGVTAFLNEVRYGARSGAEVVVGRGIERFRLAATRRGARGA